jgi:hypothetical protein
MTAVVRLLPRAFTFGPVHWRRRLIAGLLLAAILLSAYLFWFRDSSLPTRRASGPSWPTPAAA